MVCFVKFGAIMVLIWCVCGVFMGKDGAKRMYYCVSWFNMMIYGVFVVFLWGIDGET